MKHDRLDDMVKGWFVGAFAPTVLRSDACEVAIKHYTAGAYEAEHYHSVATEVTAIISGRVEMSGAEWGSGDILTIPPGLPTDFRALTDVITVVVKLPSVPDDKFIVDKTA